MLHEILRIALISVGALSIIARVMARSAELRRRPSSRLAPPADQPQ